MRKLFPAYFISTHASAVEFKSCSVIGQFVLEYSLNIEERRVYNKYIHSSDNGISEITPLSESFCFCVKKKADSSE